MNEPTAFYTQESRFLRDSSLESGALFHIMNTPISENKCNACKYLNVDWCATSSGNWCIFRKKKYPKDYKLFVNNLHYCDGCGILLFPNDMRERTSFNDKDLFYCASCAIQFDEDIDF